MDEEKWHAQKFMSAMPEYFIDMVVSLKRDCGIQDDRVVLGLSLSVLYWVVNEIMTGNEIVARNKKHVPYMKLEGGWIDDAAERGMAMRAMRAKQPATNYGNADPTTMPDPYGYILNSLKKNCCIKDDRVTIGLALRVLHWSVDEIMTGNEIVAISQSGVVSSQLAGDWLDDVVEFREVILAMLRGGPCNFPLPIH